MKLNRLGQILRPALRPILMVCCIALSLAYGQTIFADDTETVAPPPKAEAAKKLAKTAVVSSEDWKGPSKEEEFTGTLMAGVGFLNGMGGVTLLAAIAKKIVDRGFADDINDQVFIELEVGPVFYGVETDIFSSLHLRWDFHKDDRFGLYALGGAGALITTQGYYGQSQFYPRFGIGASYEVEDQFSIRAEFSREFMGLGVNFHF